MSQLDASMPDGLKVLIEGREIDPETHIPPEVIAQLKTFISVGIPKEWMIDIMDDGDEMNIEDLPPEFLETRMLLGGSFDQIEMDMAVMTNLANTGNTRFANDRLKYQTSELNIMRLVIDSIKDKLTDPSSTKLILALRGAKFFEGQLAQFASSTLEVEAKRIMLKKKDTELGSAFVVGLAEIADVGDTELENVKTLLLPDDCLSTGMTQMAILEQLFKKGYNPDNIVMLFTVGTLAGINYVYDEFENLRLKYGFKSGLTLQCGGLCFHVNEKMYLQTEEGLFMVGDMGDWNEYVVPGIPAWGDLVAPDLGNVTGTAEFPDGIERGTES